MLVIAVSMFVAFSAYADHYEVDAQRAVDLATLQEGDMVLMYHNGSNTLVGCGADGTEVSKSEKSVSGDDADAYVFTVHKSGSAVSLQNGAGYGPQISATQASVLSGFTFTFAWSKTDLTAFTVASNVAGTQLYITRSSRYDDQTAILMRADGKTGYTETYNYNASWTFYRVYKFIEPTLVSPASGTSLNLGIADKGQTLAGSLRVRGESLTGDLTLAVEGDGFSIDRTSITAEEAHIGTNVNVSFTGSEYQTYTGTITITSPADGISAKAVLVAYVVNPDDQKPTTHSQLTSWTDNAGYQEVGYMGLGNSAQVLAMALVNNASSDVPTITYRLFGNTQYINALGVYARKRDTASDYTPEADYAKYENTFAHVFDYRNPEQNCGAEFLGFTYNVPASGTDATLTSNLKLEAGEYVLYLVANIKTEDEIGGLDKLPLIGGSVAKFTRVGGEIKTVACGNSTYEINTINNYSAEGGGRVIVPKFKMIYAPRYQKFATADEYSKYYRIPAITKTADGTLLALSDARKDHIHDVTNNIDIVSRLSTDNGRSWSDYLVIFQGQKVGSDCANWNGYGDVAVASFANGSVLATAIHGYGLVGDSSDPASNVVWKVSRDNGKSWSSEYVMNQDLYGNLRGNVSPGNICVAQSGYLKGLAVAALRTSTSPNNSARTPNDDHFRLYCMTYNSDDNVWKRVTINGADYLADADQDLDEAQFVQVGENEYILSARASSSNREFYRVTFTSESEATAEKVTFSGMNLATGTNGDVITYDTKDGSTYLIHALPKDLAYSNKYCRTSLSAYYSKVSTSGNIAWTRSLDLFDPFDDTDGGEKRSGIGALDETAQYSSIAKQADGNIGVLMEAYPYAINHIDAEASSYRGHQGDWVMGQYYISLRVGDLIPDAEPAEDALILAPDIAPKSATFNSADPDERPAITISQANYEKYPESYDVVNRKVNTTYSIELFNGENERVAHSADATFDGASVALTWADVWTSLLKEDTPDEHYTADPTLNKRGYYMRVSAYCSADGNADLVSGKAAQIYNFDTPVRKIMVVGLPSSGASNIILATQGQRVGSDVWLTVGNGRQVVVNAPAKHHYVFDGFYYTYGAKGNVLLSDKFSYTKLSDIEHQITFNAPTADALPDNYNDGGVSGLVIYAVYKVEAGFASRVNTQYNNGKNPDGSFDSQHSYWVPTTDIDHIDRIVTAKGGDTFDANLVIPTTSSQANLPTGGNGAIAGGGLSYPKNLNYGLDAYVTLVPDAKTASSLNAVVRVRKADTYLPGYYVVSSYNHPLTGDIITQSKGCLERIYWYDFKDGGLVPKAVGMQSYEVGSRSHAQQVRTIEGGDNSAWYKVESDMAFQGICAAGEDFSDNVTVEIYLVDNDLTSVSQLADVNNYIAKVSHTIVQNADISTDVSEIGTGKTVAGVTYYNLLGVASDHAFEGVNVVVTTYTDGTTSAEKIVK